MLVAFVLGEVLDEAAGQIDSLGLPLSGILDPRDTYADASEWEKKAQDLASRFVKNFVKYEGNEAGKALVAAGPKA